MVADNVNGAFEIVGAFFVAFNILKLYNDKKVRGVSIVATVFFVVWGYWNLYYYPSLGQKWSAVGAASVCIANTIWFGQMIYYIRKEKNGNLERH